MSDARKVAIITGAGSGIGLALARRGHSLGHRVVVVDIDGEAAQRAANEVGGEAYTVDVCDAGALAKMVKAVVYKHGSFDYMFNNAGILVAGPVHETSESAWDRVVDVNIKGVVNGVRAAYPHMIKQGYGHIVNTASVAGLIPCPDLVAYSMTKHAVVGLSRGLRAEAQEFGVKISCVCPGIVKTPILDNARAAGLAPEVEDSKIPWTDVDECAVDVWHGVERNQDLIVVTRHAHLMRQLDRLAPRAFELAMRGVRRIRKR